MTENDQAWKRNTPEQRAQRRANWESWAQRQQRDSERRWNGVRP
jgi:hypothetical protein